MPQTTDSDTTDESYRDVLHELLKASQESYDKTVVTLSGVALGISFSFVDKFVDPSAAVGVGLLFTAWLLWGLSVTSCLLSHFSSIIALKMAVEHLDSGVIGEDETGSFMDKATLCLNVASGLLFLLGGLFLMIFVWINV